MQYILDTSSGLAKLLFRDGLWIHVPLKVCFRRLLCNLASRFTDHMTVPTFGFVSTISACKYSDKTIIVFCDLMPYTVVDPIFKVQNLSSTIKMETEFSYKISLNCCQNANVTFQKTLSSIVIAMNAGCHIFYEFWLRNLVIFPPASAKIYVLMTCMGTTPLFYLVLYKAGLRHWQRL
jgi:hypothetical protein